MKKKYTVVSYMAVLLISVGFFGFINGCETMATSMLAYSIDRLATPDPTTNPADKALKNAKESIIKTKGKPNNVVKIDDAGSEVWEYYDSPEKGKVRLYAFLNGELKNVGSRNMDEYGANSNDMAFLKKRYTDTVPCYANLRNTPSPDNTPAATPEPTPAPMKPDNPK